MSSTAGLSAYEVERLATIQANNRYLASLNLGPRLNDSTNKAVRPKKKKKSLRTAKRQPVPARSTSGRAAEVQARTEQERREVLERAAQELAERHARGTAQRAARERSQREARRQAVESARQQASEKRQRDAERAALLAVRRLVAEEAQRERLAAAQAAAPAPANRNDGVVRAARCGAKEEAEEEGQSRRGSGRRGEAAPPQHAAAMAERRRPSLRRGSETTIQPACQLARGGARRPASLAAAAASGRCGTPGCQQPLNHLGPCSAEVLSARRSAARTPRQYDEADDSESDDEADLLPVAQPLLQRTAAVHALQAQLHGGWRADGHRFLGRRAVRLFRRQPVLGTLVAWLPPAQPQLPEQPAAAAVADADADDADAADDDDDADADATPTAPPSPPALRRRSSRAAAPPAEFWRATAPPPLPRATRRGPIMVGEDAALFRVLHDDGDEEDLEEGEAAAALGLYATGRYGSDRCVIPSLQEEAAAAAAATPTVACHRGDDARPHAAAHAAAAGTGASPSAATAHHRPRTRHSHLAPRAAPLLKKPKVRPPPAAAAAAGGAAAVGEHPLTSMAEVAPEAEAAAAAAAAEEEEAEEEEWQEEGHPLLRREVARTFGRGATAEVTFGFVTRWLPADTTTGDGALFHVLHDDGDEEDLEEGEAAQAVALCVSRRAEELALSERHARMLLWGHELIGQRTSRRFGKQEVLGWIERWLPAEGGDPTLFHVLHDDGDQEDLEEAEAAQAAQEAAMLPTGHELLGKRVARYFDGPTPTLGNLTKWMPAAPRAREPALFRAVHDDGDEEDLEETEARAAIADYTQLLRLARDGARRG